MKLVRVDSNWGSMTIYWSSEMIRSKKVSSWDLLTSELGSSTVNLLELLCAVLVFHHFEL